MLFIFFIFLWGQCFSEEIIIKGKYPHLPLVDEIKELDYFLIEDKDVLVPQDANVIESNLKFYIAPLESKMVSDERKALKRIRLDKAKKNLNLKNQVIIAVIDSGISQTHPDLNNHLWFNTAEIPNDGLDNDNNGFVDDYTGWNFLDRNSDVEDDNGHGTHIGGLVLSDPKTKIMVLKSLNKVGQGDIFAAAKSIVYAANNGAHIINASWGMPFYSKVLHDAIKYAGDKGVLVITAAGNAGVNNDVVSNYPANLNEHNVLTVGSSNNLDIFSKFSNYGAKVHISAPGEDIYSTYLNNSYKRISGTSMATAIVSGVASLALSHNLNLNPLRLKNLLIEGSKKRVNLKKKVLSYSRVDAYEVFKELNKWDSIWPQKILMPRDFSFQFSSPFENGTWEIIFGKNLAEIDNLGNLKSKNKRGLIRLQVRNEKGEKSRSHLFWIY